MTADTPDAARLVGADRVLAVLRELGEHPHGVTLDALAAALDSPKPTVHRALVALRRAGFAEQTGRGRYSLGDELVRLAFAHVAQRSDADAVGPILDDLARRFGETSHYAVLDGAEVVYRAKADPPAGAVRLTSIIGGRNPAYRTAVGKLLLSRSVADRAALAAVLGPEPLAARTAHTLTDLDALWDEIERTRERGYAVDDQENETGVNCIAIPMRTDARLGRDGAISVSALAFRTPLSELVRRLPEITAVVEGA